jgi:glyoxylate/hydroxypyruvate reductase
MSLVLLTANPTSDVVQRFRAELARHLQEAVLDAADPLAQQATIAVVFDPAPHLLQSFPELRLVACAWAGVDRLLKTGPLPKDITLTRLIDPSLTQAMTETLVAHVLAMHAQWPVYRSQQAAQRWQKHRRRFATERRLLFMGWGELARPAARHLQALGFVVEGWATTPREDAGIRVHAGDTALDEALARADVIVCCLPATRATQHLLDRGRLALLKPGATLINVGRGDTVDDAALLAALQRDPELQAVLDVFVVEPLPVDHPYWSHPRVHVFPHVAAPTVSDSPAASIADVIRRFRDGGPLPERVDPERGY